jgi:predicted amidophosphoribosyltransferase
MVPLLAEEDGNIVIVPVPPRPEKVRAGKLDQVGMLANYLSRYGYRIWKGLARREGGTEQKTLARADRLKNACQSYMLRADLMDIPQKALLLDDVCTTGSTLDACARILAEKGTTVIGAIVLAAD